MFIPKIVFVPKWLETNLHNLGKGLSGILEPNSLAHILSKSDLELYQNANKHLGSMLPQHISKSFGLTHDLVTARKLAEDEELRRSYLYGRVSGMYDFHGFAYFRTNHVGYDHIALTLDMTDGNARDKLDDLSYELLRECYSYMRINEIASLPLFRVFMKNRVNNPT